MLPSPCLLMSDAHLGAAPSEREREVGAFLDHARRNAGSVVINGDLFDFWFEWRTVMPRGHVRVLGALAAIVDAGTPLVMTAGNHDAWGGDVLSKEIGVQLVQGDWDGMAAGWHAHISHGDGLRAREDRRYRALKRVMRHPLAIRAFGALHPVPEPFASAVVPCQQIEDWLYDRGTGNLLATVRFRWNVVQSITYGRVPH